MDVLGSIAAAAVGGIAGMLTGHSRSSPHDGKLAQNSRLDADHQDQREGLRGARDSMMSVGPE